MIKKDKTSILALLAIFGLTFWAAFYPGFMSIDSISQFGMSKSLQFNDWHPPIMAWAWSVAGFFFPGPSGMLAFHIALVWISVYIWWDNYKERPLSWLILIVPFLPWILNFAGVLWKDVGLAFSLFALSGLALRALTPRRALLAVLLIFYALNLRHNAIFAAFPILILLSYRWLEKPTVAKALISSSATIFLCMFLGGIFNYGLLHAEKTNPSSYMMVDDLAYLSVKKNKSFLPGVSINEIKECATIEIGQNKLVGRVFCLANQPSHKQTAPLNSDLKSIWLKNIIQNPIDYLQFRMAAFSYLLRKPTDAPYYIWHPGIDENDFGIKQVPNGLTLAAERFVKSSAAVAPFFFKPYWWLLSSLLLLILTSVLAKTKSVITTQALLISSIFYIIGYIPATPMADFRYIYWSVIATTISFVILAVDWPGFRSGVSRSRVIVASALALLSCLIIFNHGKITDINVDSALYSSLDGQRTVVADPVVTNDLLKNKDSYEITGADPFFVYDISPLNLEYQDARWLRFEFSCVGAQVTPELQFFWWSDRQGGPQETQSITRGLKEGVNLISLENYFKPMKSSRIRGIRLDLSNPSACKAISFEKIEFIK